MSPPPRKAPESALADPTKAVSTAIGLGIVFLGLNAVSVWFAPILLVMSLGGMAGVALARAKAARIEKLGDQAVDYKKITAINTDSLLPWIKENVRGHDQAAETIFQNLKKNLQLARPGRTLGSYLLVGPTGTGKTFLAKSFGAGFYPQSEVVLLKMNQYKQPGDVLALLGSPDTHSHAGGRLTQPVLDNPYRVIILEEIENAHRDVQECIAHILDSATCREKGTDRLVDFSGCMFFATCTSDVDKLRGLKEELGSPEAAGWLGRSREALAESSRFDRAFLSRWDGVFLLDRLPPLHVAEVACLQIGRYWREYGIEVGSIAPELIADIVERNQKFAEYGVQQLGRIVREKTEPALLEANRNGSKTVNLNMSDASGELQAEVPR